MSQGWQEILYKVEDRVATITLNRPDKLNAWTVVMAGELREALAKADGRRRACGRSCSPAPGAASAPAPTCRGSAAAAAGKSTLGRAADADRGHARPTSPSACSYMLAVKKPIIAAINGPVAGIGLVARALLRHPLHGGRRQAHHLVRRGAG